MPKRNRPDRTVAPRGPIIPFRPQHQLPNLPPRNAVVMRDDGSGRRDGPDEFPPQAMGGHDGRGRLLASYRPTDIGKFVDVLAFNTRADGSRIAGGPNGNGGNGAFKTLLEFVADDRLGEAVAINVFILGSNTPGPGQGGTDYYGNTAIQNWQAPITARLTYGSGNVQRHVTFNVLPPRTYDQSLEGVQGNPGHDPVASGGTQIVVPAGYVRLEVRNDFHQFGFDTFAITENIALAGPPAPAPSWSPYAEQWQPKRVGAFAAYVGAHMAQQARPLVLWKWLNSNPTGLRNWAVAADIPGIGSDSAEIPPNATRMSLYRVPLTGTVRATFSNEGLLVLPTFEQSFAANSIGPMDIPRWATHVRFNNTGAAAITRSMVEFEIEL